MPRSQTRDNAKKKKKFAAQRRKRELEAEKRDHGRPRGKSAKNQRERSD